MFTPEQVEFPHIEYMNANGITREKVTQDYLATQLDNWASAKLKYDDAVANGIYTDDAEREKELTAALNNLLELSELAYEDLQVEFPQNDGFIVPESITWPHITRMKKHFITTVELPAPLQKKIQAFNAKYNYLKENPFTTVADQEAYIKGMRTDSLDIEQDVKTFISNKTTETMQQVQQAQTEKKEDKAKQDQISALTAEIKKLVTDHHEFVKVVLKVEELKTLQPDVKELQKWIDDEKAKYFAELLANGTCAQYLQKLVENKKTKISSKELKQFKEITVPKKSLLPSTSGGPETSFVVGDYKLTAVDFLEEWKIEKVMKAEVKQAAATEKKEEKEKKEEAAAAK